MSATRRDNARDREHAEVRSLEPAWGGLPGAANIMRRSDLVQHKEKEKGPNTRTSQIVFGERQHLLRVLDSLEGTQLPIARMQQERRILEELIHARTRDLNQINTAWDEKIGLVLSSDAKPEMLEKLVKQAPEEDFYLLRLISEHPRANAKTLNKLAKHPYGAIRENVARHPNADAAAPARSPEASRREPSLQVGFESNRSKRISLRKPSAGSACELAKSPRRLLCLVDGDGNGCGSPAEGVRGVKRVGGGLRGRDGNAGASNHAGIRGNNHMKSSAYHPRQSELGAGRNGTRGRCEGRDLWGGSDGKGVLRVQRRHLEHFEVGSRNLTESVEIVVVPAIIGCAAEIQIRAVVGHDHAVFLQRLQDHLVRGGIPGDIKAGLQAHAHAHGCGVRITGIGSPVRGGKNKRSPALLQGEAQGV